MFNIGDQIEIFRDWDAMTHLSRLPSPLIVTDTLQCNRSGSACGGCNHGSGYRFRWDNDLISRCSINCWCGQAVDIRCHLVKPTRLQRPKKFILHKKT